MARKRSKVPPQPHTDLRGVRVLFRAGRWRYRAAITVEGKRIVGPLREDPESAHRDYLGLAARATAPVRAVVTLQQGLQAVLAEQQARGRASERSRASTASVCEALLRAWEPDLVLADLTAEDLDWYVTSAVGAGRSLTTVIEKDLPVLRGALKSAGIRWPAEFSTPRKPRRVMAVLTSDEVARLLEGVRSRPIRDRRGNPLSLAARAHHADIMELLYLTGLRAGELARITVADIDLSRCTIKVRNHKDAGAALQASEETLALGEESRDLLARLVASAAPAARARGDGQRPASMRLIPGGELYLSTMFARWAKRLGEPRLCGRTLRHSFVSATLQLTGDLAMTRDLARHRSVQTTARYVHALTQQQRETRAALAGLLKASQTPAGGA